MQKTNDDIRQRTKQMISLCRNADALADQTVMTLADQHEQLTNIDTHLSAIDATLVHTKNDINRLKGITRCVIDAFRSKFHSKIVSKVLLQSRKKGESFSPSRGRQVSLTPISPNTSSSNSFHDEQLNEFFDQIGHLLHGLKDKACTINDQLIAQNDVLDHIHNQTIESTDHLEQQNLAMKKLKSNY